MDSKLKLAVLVSASLLLLVLEAKKPIDPYKVLGVDRKANQREIQKAFHKLSLQYHPDKNKNKGAQEKFEEINNAYEILSDEDKRKNYDLYGDERGGPSFGGGNNEEDYGGYSYFKSGGPGQGGFNFRPGGWQDMGGQGKSQSFSFSFGGPSGGNSFGDLFSNFFGGDAGGGGGFNFGGFGGSSGSHFGGFQGSSGPKSGTKNTPKNVRAVTSQLFQKEIYDKGIVWILVSYTQSIGMDQHQESVLEEVAHSLKGAIKVSTRLDCSQSMKVSAMSVKFTGVFLPLFSFFFFFSLLVGKINCGNEPSFCKNHGIQPRRYARVFVYSYVKSDSGSFIEYNDEWDAKVLKSFCQEHIPRFSRRVRMDEFGVSDDASGEAGLPRVMLLSTKKDTPMIWRVLSGLYRSRFIFYDTQVKDVSDPNVKKKLGVDALPAIVGWLPNGERQTLKTGITVKDLESAVKDISVLLDRFEKSKKVASKKSGAESSSEKQIPILMASNMDSACGESASVCIIGVFRSSKSKQKLESLLSIVGQKSLSRRRSSNMLFGGSKDAVTYALLDGAKQQSFLGAFDEKLGSKSSSSSEVLLLLAYKPRKGKYAAVADSDLDIEEVEKFVSSVLSGDVQFSKTKHKPALK